jgi:hypothetical protein
MKKVWLLLIPVLLLACTCSLPSLVPTRTPPPAGTIISPGTLTGLTVVQLDPDNGDLLLQLDTEASKASALGQHMFVEFDASW